MPASTASAPHLSPSASAQTVPAEPVTDVLRLRDMPEAGRELSQLLQRFGLNLEHAIAGKPIPGSYWGDEEAGLIGNRVFARPDTPVHSILHEACHAICMDDARRETLHTDAGGEYAEEDAVCYLQILLADLIPPMSRDRMCADMDAWGYTFRLGSARAWFESDAADARDWLVARRLPRVDAVLEKAALFPGLPPLA